MYQEVILDHYRRPQHSGLREPFGAEVHHREIVVEVSDALIELGVKGAAFLQQDLVRHAR